MISENVDCRRSVHHTEDFRNTQSYWQHFRYNVCHINLIARCTRFPADDEVFPSVGTIKILRITGVKLYTKADVDDLWQMDMGHLQVFVIRT